MTDYRALCAELVELCTPVDSIPQLAERLQKLNALAERARALLAEADGPAVPDGREPASVALQPSDGEVAELVEWLHRRAAEVQAENCTTIYSPHLRRVADLLAQRHPAPQPVPEVEGPTDEELPEDFIGFEKGFAQEHLARLMRDAIGTETNHNAYIVAAGRILDRPEFAHVARWGRPTPQPVAVSERWPNFSDCDPQERVWAWNPVLDHWKLSRINRSVHTHWLPAHALPLPLPAPEATNE